MARWTAVFSLAISVCAQAAWADGQLDPSFGSGGRVDLGLVNSSGVEGASQVLPLGDGRFVAVGAGEGKGIWVTRHLANGSLDGSFGAAGGTFFPQTSYSFASDAVREPNGSIVVAGGESAGFEFDTLVARLTPQGALDPSFGNDPPHPTGDGISVFNLGEDDIANGVTIDSTGKIVIVGRTGPNVSHDVLLARFNSDGSVDSSFGGPTGVHTNLGGNDIGTAVAMQGERIVVLANSGPSIYVLGYRSDGTLDPAFGAGNGIAPVSFPTPKVEPNALLVQPDGRILVAGSNATHAYIARLQSNGSPDTSFGSGGVASFEPPSGAKEMYATALAQGDDGKIVAAATSYGGGPSHAVLLRVLPGGQPDPAWGTNGVLTLPSPPETSDYAYALAVEPNRRILVGGETFAHGNDDRLLERVLGDTTPPDTAITRAPRRRLRLSRRPVTVAFKAVGDVHTTFECKLIRPKRKGRHRRPVLSAAARSAVAFSACASPVKYRNLRRPGRYRFAVRAIDPAGNVDPTPATVTFRVLPKKRH